VTSSDLVQTNMPKLSETPPSSPTVDNVTNTARFEDVTSSVVKSSVDMRKKQRLDPPRSLSSTTSVDILSQLFPGRSRSNLEEVLRHSHGDLNKALETCTRTSASTTPKEPRKTTGVYPYELPQHNFLKHFEAAGKF